jgi:hypothetical protein
MSDINIWFQFKGKNNEKIAASEVRLEIRKIEEKFYGTVVTTETLDRLNGELNNYINKPYGLNIRAEFLNNNVKLYGYDDDSKVVLDPNCNIHHISKTKIKRMF